MWLTVIKRRTRQSTLSKIGESAYQVGAGQLARLSRGTSILIRGAAGGRVLIITGKPIGEPVVHYGPFVMNSVAQIEQAIRDYNAGTLVSPQRSTV
ncbi:MAG: hypothetical protein EXR84_14115 [Gammaproteobacteria bacterium]|nr:hypothetical protein [Gammaproteobacteria bacterium]